MVNSVFKYVIHCLMCKMTKNKHPEIQKLHQLYLADKLLYTICLNYSFED